MPPLSQLPEGQFQALFEQSPIGIIVFGPEGDCRGANRAWERIWNTPSDHLKGYNILKDPQLDSGELISAIRKAFQGEPQYLPLTFYDPAASGQPGRPRYIQGIIFPILDDAKRVCHVVSHFTDVTSQETLKRELSASSDFLGVINRVAPTIIAVYDVTTGEYLHLNDAFEKLLGYPVDEARRAGLPFMLSLIHPEDAPKIQAQQEEALRKFGMESPDARTNPIIPFEYRMRARDGSWKCLRTLGSVFQRHDDGSIKTVINASLDVTELKDAIRFRDEFLAIASHELKSPLTPLKLQVDVLNSVLESGSLNAIPSESLKRITQITGHQIDRLTGLVNNLLDVSRITVGRLELKAEEADLGDFVRGVVEGFHTQLDAAACALTLDAPSGVHLPFDSLRMSQVICNLLNNVITHSGSPTLEVRVESLPAMAKARIIVRDKGKGIAVEEQERIFERFERILKSDNVTGLGLGLFIARQIARAHGGDIRVESRLGFGTTFTVELPRSMGIR